MPKVSVKFEWGHPQRGCQMQVGYVETGDVWQITHYNSKTVQDRPIVSIKVEHTLSNSDIAGDLQLPLTSQNNPIYTFFLAFHIFIVG